MLFRLFFILLVWQSGPHARSLPQQPLVWAAGVIGVVHFGNWCSATSCLYFSFIWHSKSVLCERMYTIWLLCHHIFFWVLSSSSGNSFSVICQFLLPFASLLSLCSNLAWLLSLVSLQWAPVTLVWSAVVDVRVHSRAPASQCHWLNQWRAKQDSPYRRCE